MIKTKRRILVTGANGFIGKNLVVSLKERKKYSICSFVRGDAPESLYKLVSEVDTVVHLAGENRPVDESDFQRVNAELTSKLCDAIQKEFIINGRHVPLVFASSAQAEVDNSYGRSKLDAEKAVVALSQATGNSCAIFRFSGVFGKWGKPNYNSVVATFCHNVSRDLPLQINDPAVRLRLVFVDDVVAALIHAVEDPALGCVYASVNNEYSMTVGELAEQIRSFAACRSSLLSERVGAGVVRALYATYISYLPREKFSYEVKQHTDSRGVFVEMLKTVDSGQFSYFTAHPGITRGGHYHHTKTEKFLVTKGQALFRFRHLLTDERYELRTSGDHPMVVDTIPGWTHDITNVGKDDMVVLLWANENYDPQKPDTVYSEV